MDRFGYSIFCDDIRNEPGGKLSFIGCYNGAMFVSSTFPLELPKFCVHVHILSPANRPYSSILARCYAPGVEKPIVEEPIEPPTQGKQTDLTANLESVVSAPVYIVAGASLIFTPLQIDRPGLIRVRAVVDGASEEIRLGSLRVEATT
jgi:hypothetical protein